jgi:hypothetical protein
VAVQTGRSAKSVARLGILQTSVGTATMKITCLILDTLLPRPLPHIMWTIIGMPTQGPPFT